MKTKLLPLILLSTTLMAIPSDFEVTPVIGYSYSEANLDMKSSALYGGEIQYNNKNSILSPEISVLYSDKVQSQNVIPEILDNTLYRFALNGVFQYENATFITPLTKIGLGYETIEQKYSQNIDSVFVNVGVGAKLALTENIALKIEAIHMAKFNSNRWDNNTALLGGITLAFGTSMKDEEARRLAQIEAENQAKIDARIAAEALKAEQDAQAREAALAAAIAKKEALEQAKREAEEKAAALLAAEAIANADDDKDGVKNALDACPNTPLYLPEVNSVGCLTEVNLQINFIPSSFDLTEQSKENIQAFALYLRSSPQYSVKILSHTDSIGEARPNLKVTEKRANVVRDMLISQGVEPERVTAKGMGEAHPITSNMLKAGRAQNRRIIAELTKIK